MSNHEWWWHFCAACQKYFEDRNLEAPKCSHCGGTHGAT